MVPCRLPHGGLPLGPLLHEERETEIGGLWSITGFAQHPVPVAKASTSATTYTIRRRIALLVNAVTSFSVLPLTVHPTTVHPTTPHPTTRPPMPPRYC